MEVEPPFRVVECTWKYHALSMHVLVSMCRARRRDDSACAGGDVNVVFKSCVTGTKGACIASRGN